MAVLVVLAAVALAVATPRIGRAVEEALARRDVTPVLEAVERMRPGGRTAALNHAIRKLWNRYERRLALDLVVVLAERHTDSLIAQYWIKQAMTVEPELARERLDDEFLRAHYRPELAAQCGPVG